MPSCSVCPASPRPPPQNSRSFRTPEAQRKSQMFPSRILRIHMWPRLAWIVAVVVLPAVAQDFSGRWIGEEDGQPVELILEQKAGRIAGSLVAVGRSVPVEGRA